MRVRYPIGAIVKVYDKIDGSGWGVEKSKRE
jgi:hypothetical protein